jgi:site-specific DNA-methyltransferase (adenine-specific)
MLESKTPAEFLADLPDQHAHCVVLRQQYFEPDAFRILRPGGICLAFATTRTLSNKCKALEEAGFVIRDVIAWVNPSISSSSFGMSHLITRSQGLSELEKDQAMVDIAKLRTMRLRSCYVPIVLAQRPTSKTLVMSQIENGCGLMNPTRVASGALSSNCVTTDFTDTLYDQAFLVKSVPNSRLMDEQPDPMYRIMHHLIETFSQPGGMIVDPQAGDGAVMCAAIHLGRGYAGTEDNLDRRAAALERAARCASIKNAESKPDSFRMAL